MATINEALKKLFLGLGGDPDELKDNNTVSDYIDDLESAIETAASGASAELIDDEEASSTKTYSSSKIESLIPENELPTPAVGDIGKVVSVVSDGESGAEYSLETPASVVYYEVTISGTSVTLPSGVTKDTIKNQISSGVEVALTNTDSDGVKKIFHLSMCQYTEFEDNINFTWIGNTSKTSTKKIDLLVINISSLMSTLSTTTLTTT